MGAAGLGSVSDVGSKAVAPAVMKTAERGSWERTKVGKRIRIGL